MVNETYGCLGRGDKIGVLIGQLGTPDAPTKEALRPYLKRFLSDRRVIEKPRFLWWLILNAFILPRRPARSAALYRRIWTDEGSPLLLHTQRVTDRVRERLRSVHPSIEVVYGMRYSDPTLESGVDALIERGCSKILLFNMYPQYSATTVASNYDAVFRHLLTLRNVPTLRVAEPYFRHPDYVTALATTINESMASLEQPAERLVFSYHGIPEEYVRKGDIYCCQCSETSRALIPLLDLDPDQIIHTYQSRFGRDPWLEPYTDETIRDLPERGVKRIAVACPGFPADCLETLDEIGHEAREDFMAQGGESFHLIPCLNDHPAWIEGMTRIIEGELGSWLDGARADRPGAAPLTCPVAAATGRHPVSPTG